jgi:hypothetical protein
MADIFLSCTHIDRPHARPIVDLLEQQGWWDRSIEPGIPWRPKLDVVLGNGRAIIVPWSQTSTANEWFCHETRAGKKKGSLVPILLDEDELPFESATVQATDLSHWKGETDRAKLEALLRRLTRSC